jgi:hypothetical protein
MVETSRAMDHRIHERGLKIMRIMIEASDC